jgi:caspase domain-containing protein/sulfatase-modifying factor enzyme 1
MVRAAIALLVLLLMPSVASAEKRVALLIGNESYTPAIGALANPHNDVALLGNVLKGLGFDVTSVRDAGLAGLHQAVNSYVRRVRQAGPDAVAFFYYSGHGAADAGTNYLIPVDVKSADDGEFWDQSLRLTEITRKLKDEAGNATHFVIFDACRNTLKLKKAGSKAVVQSKGFVPVSQESGMLIPYATAEGALASDVGVGAGPYAKVLAEEIVKPGIESVAMFRIVQRRVRVAISQEPYLGFNALGDVYLAGLRVDPPKAPSPSPMVPPRPEDGSLGQSLACVNAKDKGGCERAGCAWLAGSCMTQTNALALKPAMEKKPSQAAPTARCDGIETLVGNEPRCLKPKDSFKDCDTCPEMVVVPPGEFMMGPDDWDFDNRRSHRVSIARSFAVGKFEVTFAEWDVCTTEGGCQLKPEGTWGRGRQPVHTVSWSLITKQYIPWLRRRTGKSYRLLSEAEWEYAARAGTSTRYAFGDTITQKQAQFTSLARLSPSGYSGWRDLLDASPRA